MFEFELGWWFPAVVGSGKCDKTDHWQLEIKPNLGFDFKFRVEIQVKAWSSGLAFKSKDGVQGLSPNQRFEFRVGFKFKVSLG